MKISAKTHPKQIAGAIFNAVKEQGFVDLISIGAGAVNNCNKAMATAREFFEANNIKVSFEPHWDETLVEDRGSVVAIKWIVRRA